MVKLLTAGDLHLDAGADLGHAPGDRLREQENVWRWSLEQAREHDVDFIAFAGDAFQHRKPSVEALLAFERPLVEHRAAGGPPVIAIPGNHDLSSLDSGCALDVFHEAGLIELARTPRVVLAEGGARVALMPWAPVSRLAANYDGPRDLLNDHAASLLVEAARQLYEEATAFPFKTAETPLILLTHFSISGTSLPSGLPVDQLREPVLDQDELLAIGYDAVIAGHIHKPQAFGLTGLYVGSPMPLNFGESDGLVRGPWLFEWDGDRLLGGEQLEAPSRRFVNLDFPEAFNHEEPPDVENAYVKVRARLDEKTAHIFKADDLRRELVDRLGAYRVFIDQQIDRPARARDLTVDDSMDEREALRRWLDAQHVDADLAERALQRAEQYLSRDAGESFSAPVVQEPLAVIA